MPAVVRGPGGTLGGAADLGRTIPRPIPSDTWVLEHSLPYQPSVTVVDSAGSQVEGDVRYDAPGRITVTFSGAFSGTAYLS